MAKFETVPVERIKVLGKLTPAEEKKVKAFQGYIAKLTPTTGGVLTLGRGESVKSTRVVLRRAAALSGKKIIISVTGNQLAFYLTKERKKKVGRPARAKKRAGRPPKAKRQVKAKKK